MAPPKVLYKIISEREAGTMERENEAISNCIKELIKQLDLLLALSSYDRKDLNKISPEVLQDEKENSNRSQEQALEAAALLKQLNEPLDLSVPSPEHNARLVPDTSKKSFGAHADEHNTNMSKCGTRKRKRPSSSVASRKRQSL